VEVRVGHAGRVPDARVPPAAQPSTADPSAAQPPTAEPPTAEPPTGEQPTGEQPTGEQPAAEPYAKAAAPTAPVEVPDAVAALAAGDAVRAVWRNEVGGLTFELTGPTARRFVKWVPAGCGIDLAAEAARLAWAEPFTPVPRVLTAGADADGSWLVTAALDGTSAVDPRWVARPEVAARALGTGLRALHDALPVASCPFTWHVRDRVARTLPEGRRDRVAWHPDHRHLPLVEARARLADIPDPDRLVVCHGDPCAPNTLLDADGRWAAHVDLGTLGVADRWADLAVATWSTVWNYGPGFEHLLLDAYGVAPDAARTAFYRLVWDLSA
jgi:kanamycin kinase